MKKSVFNLIVILLVTIAYHQVSAQRSINNKIITLAVADNYPYKHENYDTFLYAVKDDSDYCHAYELAQGDKFQIVDRTANEIVIKVKFINPLTQSPLFENRCRCKEGSYYKIDKRALAELIKRNQKATRDQKEEARIKKLY